MTTPASIRYKNPGAMWPGSRATKWGSTTHVTLTDAQHNEIAIFPDFVHGAAAQFDLWASNYTSMTLKAAIDKWSGHNSPASYVNYLQSQTGVSINTVLTRSFFASDAGWKLLKAQSRWEAGQPIPMTDAEWQQAQKMVFGAAAPGTPSAPSKPAALPVLRFGNQGEVVKKLQTALGFGASEVDGIFGHDTDVALRAAQFTHGLANDGVCGPASWAMLKVTGA